MEQDIAKNIATAFTRILNEWLTPEQIIEVNRKNSTPEYNNCCATHDYCDSNVAMLEAFKEVMGREHAFADEETLEADTDITNAAWQIAKNKKFKKECTHEYVTGEFMKPSTFRKCGHQYGF